MSGYGIVQCSAHSIVPECPLAQCAAAARSLSVLARHGGLTSAAVIAVGLLASLSMPSGWPPGRIGDEAGKETGRRTDGLPGRANGLWARGELRNALMQLTAQPFCARNKSSSAPISYPHPISFPPATSFHSFR